MTKAKQYHLNFKTVPSPNIYKPVIECDTDSSGYTLSIELAGFLASCNENETQEIIDDVISLDAFNSGADGYEISANEYDSVEIFSPPARASFWNGTGYNDIPLQDFLDILNEWIAFLNSLSGKYKS
ncbi:hypothetical protein [Ferruginibacter sp.]|nr:hypothetical protein [Ferruginibacter sp.]